jgi:hypothetical protein
MKVSSNATISNFFISDVSFFVVANAADQEQDRRQTQFAGGIVC